jgi:hypothetical protein
LPTGVALRQQEAGLERVDQLPRGTRAVLQTWASVDDDEVVVDGRQRVAVPPGGPAQRRHHERFDAQNSSGLRLKAALSVVAGVRLKRDVNSPDHWLTSDAG